MDKWTYRRAMPFLCTVTALLIGTLSLTAKMHQVFFFIWVCLIYLCIGGFYAMFPAYTSISFGNLYMTANYGWIFTNQFISSFVSAFFSTPSSSSSSLYPSPPPRTPTNSICSSSESRYAS